MEAFNGPVLRAEGASGTNIYGETLRPCETKSQTFGLQKNICSYSAASPKVCVSVVEKKYDEASDDSGERLNEKCLSVWNLGALPDMTDMWFGDSKFIVQCDALPAEALLSQYTKDEASNQAKYRKYEWYEWDKLGRKLWKTGDWTEQTVKGGEERSYWLGGAGASKGERFRDSVASICNQCSAKATSASAKEALESKCAALNVNIKVAASELPSGGIQHLIPGLLAMASFMLALVGLKKVGSFQKIAQEVQEPLLQC
jgi:hypothetical protein